MSNFVEVVHFCHDLPYVVDDQFIKRLKAQSLYHHLLVKTSTDDSTDPITGLFSWIQVLRVHFSETNDFDGDLSGLPSWSKPLSVEPEQQNDEESRELIFWKLWGLPDPFFLLNTLRKNRKQFSRLVVKDDILFRLFFDYCGKMKYQLFLGSNKLWAE